ncbi:2-oxoacid:acceptor oxidoreductase, partial [Megasphaera sp. SW808]|nr:2-oxoacid:acceptor oxidoreductase [Megasphaera sp. SW808]
MAMHLTFRKERCKGCGLCIAVCPKQILALEDNA